MSPYREWHGSWWAVQVELPRPLALGFHVEQRRRHTSDGVAYGPYVDLHLPFLIVSVGANPIYAGEHDLLRSYSRGGDRA